MSSQRVLFHDSVWDAISTDIMAMGGFKVVAAKLWPSKDLTAAANTLRNAVNPEQAQKLCPDELMQIKRLAREVNSTATIDYEAQQLGFQVTWIDPKDQAEALRREVRDMLEIVSRKLDRIERAEERAVTLKAVGAQR
jgi:hypothetical protein